MRQLSPTPHQQYHWTPTRQDTLFKIRHSLGLQQHLYRRRRPLESSIQNPLWTLQTHRHVLWTHQFTGHVLQSNAENAMTLVKQIPRQDRELHQRHDNSHERELPTPSTNSRGATRHLPRKFILFMPSQVQIWGIKNWVFGLNSWWHHPVSRPKEGRWTPQLASYPIHSKCYDQTLAYYADTLDCIIFLSFPSLHRSPCMIWSRGSPLYDMILWFSLVRYDLVASLYAILSPHFNLYDIYLRSTHTTILSIRGVQIPIDLVSSAMDSTRRRVVLFKPVQIPTSDPKSEFLCQLSLLLRRTYRPPWTPRTPEISPTPSSPRITRIVIAPVLWPSTWRASSVISKLNVLVTARQLKSSRTFNLNVTVKEVQSVLGILGYQRPFIPHYADIARPLTTLTKKNSPFIWTSECRTVNWIRRHPWGMCTVTKSESVVIIPSINMTLFLLTDDTTPQQCHFD